MLGVVCSGRQWKLAPCTLVFLVELVLVNYFLKQTHAVSIVSCMRNFCSKSAGPFRTGHWLTITQHEGEEHGLGQLYVY